jgi:tRNA A-37 threonylcarbamoyl transferase component Bud32
MGCIDPSYFFDTNTEIKTQYFTDTEAFKLHLLKGNHQIPSILLSRECYARNEEELKNAFEYFILNPIQQVFKTHRILKNKNLKDVVFEREKYSVIPDKFGKLYVRPDFNIRIYGFSIPVEIKKPGVIQEEIIASNWGTRRYDSKNKYTSTELTINQVLDYMYAFKSSYAVVSTFFSTWFIKLIAPNQAEISRPVSQENLRFALMKFLEEVNPATNADMKEKMHLMNRVSYQVKGEKSRGLDDNIPEGFHLTIPRTVIGHGAIGTVELFEYMGMEYAVKWCPVKATHCYEALLNEVACYKKLEHLQGLCIPKLFFCGHQLGAFMIGMQYIKPGRPVDWETDQPRVDEVMRRVENAGVCHNDIREENIIVDSNEVLWVIDFSHAETNSSKAQACKKDDHEHTVPGCTTGASLSGSTLIRKVIKNYFPEVSFKRAEDQIDEFRSYLDQNGKFCGCLWTSFAFD